MGSENEKNNNKNVDIVAIHMYFPNQIRIRLDRLSVQRLAFQERQLSLYNKM